MGYNKKSKREKFIEKSNKIHKFKYDYSKINYINSHTKIYILCPSHGGFWQLPYGHLEGYEGCKVCQKIINSGKNSLTQKEFIERAKIIHEDKYDYSNVIYINNRINVKIICPIHGEFLQRPTSHLYMSCGCKKCSYEKLKIERVKSLDDFIKQANIVHGLKYDYSKINYINSNEKICIICPKHGEFWQVPYKHLQQQGCPICKESKLEKQIRKLLIKNNIKFIQQYSRKDNVKWIKSQSLDFYLSEYNIAIECQGEQHFKPVDFGNNGNEYAEKAFKKNLKRDKIKYDLCKKYGIKIMYFTDKINYINGKYLDIIYSDEIELINSIEKINGKKRLL